MTVVSRQVNMELSKIKQKCPLYESNGNTVSAYMMIRCVYLGENCTVKPLKKKTKIDFQDQLSLNAGQKYCKMLQREHSAILSTSIKLPSVIKKPLSCLFLSGRLRQVLLFSKFSFWEVLGRIYGQKISFMGTCLWNPKTSISDYISDDVPPQMKILNIVIPILMH